MNRKILYDIARKELKKIVNGYLDFERADCWNLFHSAFFFLFLIRNVYMWTEVLGEKHLKDFGFL